MLKHFNFHGWKSFSKKGFVGPSLGGRARAPAESVQAAAVEKTRVGCAGAVERFHTWEGWGRGEGTRTPSG